MVIRRAFWIVLLPALALAAPKKGRTPKGKGTPATTKPAEGSGSGSGSGSASEDKDKDKDKPAEKPEPADDKTAPQTPDTSDKTEPKDKEEKPTKGNEPDVDSLRQEYLSLRDELFKSRARANAVASSLYSTRISIKLTWGSARYYAVSKSSIRLDGATVFEDGNGAIANDDGVRFEGYVAPGKHLVTFHVDAAGKDDDSFTSSTESQVVVKAVAGKDLVVAAKGKDSGDIAYEWKRKEKGSYDLGLDVAVKTVASEGGAAAAPAKGAKK